ncbi:hypothetical protein CF635_003617 [Enterobacter hormaechei]|nr:hypothetical protein [Enterobacter hormaechei]
MEEHHYDDETDFLFNGTSGKTGYVYPERYCVRRESIPWVFDATYGYILDVGSMHHPLLRMKQAGLSKSLRKFVYHMQRKYNAMYIHFDCDANPVEGEETFDW